MKEIFIGLIILISIYGFSSKITPNMYLNFYAFIVFLPLTIIVLKKNLLNGLLLWLLLLIFKGVPWIKLQGLPDIAPYRMLWLMIMFIILFELIVKQRKLIGGIRGIKIAMILFCSYALLSMVPTGLIFKEGQGAFLMNYVIPFTTFFISRALITSEQDIKKVFIFMSILGFYLGFTGICEYLKLDFLIFPSYITDIKKGIHYGMARGPFLETSQNGVVIGMVLFMVIHTLTQSHEKSLKIFFGLTIPLIIGAFIFTFNRASWIGAFFASLVLPIFYPKVRKYFVMTFLILIMAVVAFRTGMIKLPEKKNLISTHSVAGRIVQFDGAWNMFLDKPIIGYGFNNHMKYIPKYYRFIKGLPVAGIRHHQLRQATVHNVVLNMLLQLGLIVTGLYIYIIYCIMAISVRLYRLLPQNGFAGKGIVITYWGMSSIFFMKYMFTDWRTEMFPIVFFFMISGIIVGLYQRTLSKIKNESYSMNVDNPTNVLI